MTYYAARGAVLDRFLAEHDVDPDEVLSVEFAKYAIGIDIRVHIYTRVPGLDYVPNENAPQHSAADVEREDLTISVVYVHNEDKEVAA